MQAGVCVYVWECKTLLAQLVFVITSSEREGTSVAMQVFGCLETAEWTNIAEREWNKPLPLS